MMRAASGSSTAVKAHDLGDGAEMREEDDCGCGTGEDQAEVVTAYEQDQGGEEELQGGEERDEQEVGVPDVL